MQLFYKIAADVIVVLHAAFVLFVVMGLVLILLGAARSWKWVRNPWFRIGHLICIGFVVGETLLGFVCPLTTWEQQLRELAGEESYRGDFIAHWVHEMLFFEFPDWVFTLTYSLFGLAVLAALWLFPPEISRMRGIRR